MKRVLITGLLALLMVFVAPALAQIEPTLQVSPGVVELGDTIDVMGTNFAPGAMVSAFLGVPETGMRGEAFTSAEVAADGTFSLSFTMPETWPSGAPISERDLLVVIASDFQPLASAPFTFNGSLDLWGWQEYYIPMFDFSIMAPSDWTAGGSIDGVGFILPGSMNVGLSARAVSLPQGIDAEAVMAMTLEEYIEASPELELFHTEGSAPPVLSNVTPVTTRTGERGYVAEVEQKLVDGSTFSWVTAYFDLNQMMGGYLYRTIQIQATDPTARVFFDAIVSSFTRGRQQPMSDACTLSEATAELTNIGIMDTQDLIEALCAAGATVMRGEAVPELAIPIFHAPGLFLSVNGVDVQVYEYPDEAAAQTVREGTTPVPGGTLIGATNVGWLTLPHFFGAGRLIVLYTGDDPTVFALLESLLGPQVAGGPAPEVSDEVSTISWEDARQLILDGEVRQIFQSHALEVRLTLPDGRQVTTTEPSIDDVFRVVEECGDLCAGIALATE